VEGVLEQLGVENHFQERSAELQGPRLAPPDFPSKSVALIESMRLSLRRAAHVVVGGGARWEIRVQTTVLLRIAVICPTNLSSWSCHEPGGQSKKMKNAFRPATTLQGSTVFPLSSLDPTNQSQMEAPPSPLSSRAKSKDLQF
jgi:hypothetical protein